MPSWIFFALLSAFFAALVAIFGKIGIQQVDSTLATTVRSIVMAIFLVIVSVVFGKASLLGTIDRKALFYIIVSGVAGALSWLCYFVALRGGPATPVAALDRTSVVFVLLLSVIFLSEQLTWRSGLGAFFVALGASIMVIK